MAVVEIHPEAIEPWVEGFVLDRHVISSRPIGFDDLKDLLAQGDSDSVERIVNELHLEVLPHRVAG